MVAAAIELAQAGGLRAVTISAVTERSSTSNGALYHRFGGRVGLLLAAQDQVLTSVELATAAAFATAEREPDDDRAVRLLAAAALDVFTEHRGAMRAFLVEARYVVDAELFTARVVRTNHELAHTVTGWLMNRFAACETDAEATWRILFALASSQALFDDHQFSARTMSDTDLADALARSVTAVARRPPE